MVDVSVDIDKEDDFALAEIIAASLNDPFKIKEICAFKHYGFWQPMDTLREKNILTEMWNNNKAPWKTSKSSKKILSFKKAI